MAYIYKITNVLNGKCYVGKTEKANPEDRFQEHKNDSKRYVDRPLYRAFNKYGTANFAFDVIEETNNPEEREIYWIKELNSHGSTGYNATLGGEGTKYLNYEKIIEDYLLIQNRSEVARLNNCHLDSITKILRSEGILILDSPEVNKKRARSVIMLDKKTKEPLMEFESQTDAAKYLKENNFSNISALTGISSKIGFVCRGKRQSCAGFGWKYKE